MNSAKWQNIKDLTNQALDLPHGERADFFSRESDEEIRFEAEQLLAAIESSEDFIGQPFLIEHEITEDLDADIFIGREIGNYVIEQRIGTGGMGAVYLAQKLNSDFKQKVALKLIKRGMDSEAITNRFSRERKILSTLKHPNIAQLLDGGISKEGLPFFVMEYIDGKPLHQFCNTQNLLLGERLRIFRQICSAVEHAHQNLIIHRDLKPSNILVTQDGTPKLLDFGIAKLLSDEESETTQTKNKVLTPEYASPEQILGKNVTTATDVYSLGVILYQILSGHRPFDARGKSYGEIIKSVCEIEPVRPSAVSSEQWSAVSRKSEKATLTNDEQIATNDDDQKTNSKFKIQNSKSLQGDLDNIVLKALRKEPSERYATVLQFSEDIERYLKGLPVTARPQTLQYRFEKYIKRHKVGVAAAALILLSLIGGISVATWQAIIARRERTKSDQRFAEVWRLTHIIMFEYSDGLEKLSGSTPLREKMVKDSLEYLDRLSIDSDANQELRRDIIAAYIKVGDIQGNPYSANLGDLNGSLESYQKALAIAENLYAANPEDRQNQNSLGKAYQKLGEIYWGKGESQNSLDNCRRAVEIYEKLSAEKNLSDPLDLPRVYNSMGDGYIQLANYRTAQEVIQKALEINEKLLNEEPSSSDYKGNVGVYNGRIGDTFYLRSDYKTAAEFYEKSLPFLREVSESDPTNTKKSRLYALMLARTAMVYTETKDYASSIRYHLAAIKIIAELTDADPNNTQLRYILGDLQGNLAEAYGWIRNESEAKLLFEKSFDNYRIILEKNTGFAQIYSHYANNLLIYGEMLLRNGERTTALEKFKEGIEKLDKGASETESAEIRSKLREAIKKAQF